MVTFRALPALAILASMAAAAQAQVVNHPTTFTGQTDLTFTNNASVTAGGTAQLTPAVNDRRGSFWTTVQVPVDKFRSRFTFHEIGTANNMADGIGFCLQRIGNTAIGGAGGGMGWSGIGAASVFVKFDNYNNESSTGLYTAGSDPAVNSVNMRPNVDIHSLHNFLVDMLYNGTTIVMSVTDLTTNAVFNQTFTVDLPTTLGGGTGFVGFTGATGGLNANQEILNWIYIPAPAGLTPTGAPNSVTLNWTAVTGAAGYAVYRGTTNGGPYPTKLGNPAGTTFTDATAVWPNTYYYVVRAVVNGLEGPDSNQATGVPLAPAVTATPNTGLQTSELPTTTTFNVSYNQPATAGSQVTVTSNDPSEGLVSSAANPTPMTSIVINVATGFTGTIPITVTGRPDFQVDGNVTYTISVTASGMGVTIPNVSVMNNDIDVAGITVSKTSGLLTSENLTIDTFDVSLTSRPFGNIDLPIASLRPTEATVSPATLTFTPSGNPIYNATTGVGDWNVPHTVTVTGVDDGVLDFSQTFDIQLDVLQTSNGNDLPGYNIDPPDVSGFNLDNEAVPSLKPVWGGNGGGGCGLLGLECGLVMVLAAIRRRR